MTRKQDSAKGRVRAEDLKKLLAEDRDLLKVIVERSSMTSNFLTLRASVGPRQGFVLPAKAALDPNRHLPDDIQYEGEALFRIVRSRDPLLSLWREWNARHSGS